MAKQVNKSMRNVNDSDMFPQLHSVISEEIRLTEEMLLGIKYI